MYNYFNVYGCNEYFIYNIFHKLLDVVRVPVTHNITIFFFSEYNYQRAITVAAITVIIVITTVRYQV